MKKIIITILLLSLTGCVRQESLGAKESILKGIDDNVIAIDKIDTKDGELKIENTDDNTDETFIIKSDKARYSLSDNKLDVILGITNTRDAEYGVIKLKYSKDEKIVFAGTYSTTTEIKIIENYQDVEVACPTKSASSTCYTNELVSTTSKEIIVDSWTSINLAKASDKTSILQKETIGKYDSNEIRYFFPKGTTFIKITLEAVSTLTFKDEFYVEVFGENGGYGMLDPLIDNIVSYWKLEEKSGTRYDELNSYDLSETNTVGYGTGKIGNAAAFVVENSEKLTQQIDLPLAKSFNLWIKITDDALAYQSIIAGRRWVDANNYDSIDFRFNGKKLQFFEIWRSNASTFSAKYIITNSDVLSKDNWQMVTLTADSNTTDPTFKIYVNSSLVDTTQTEDNNNARRALDCDAGGFTISGYSSWYIDGYVDEVGYWDRTLSSAEVAALYNSGNGLAYPFSSGTTVISQESDLIVFEE